MRTTLEIHNEMMGCIAQVSNMWEKFTYYSKVLSFQLDPLTQDLISALNLRNEGKIATYLNSSQYLIQTFLQDYNKYVTNIVQSGGPLLQGLSKVVNDFSIAFEKDPSIPAGEHFQETIYEASSTFTKQITGHEVLIRAASYYKHCDKISTSTLEEFELNVQGIILLYRSALEIMERYGKLWKK
jgi:hypothetical protein